MVKKCPEGANEPVAKGVEKDRRSIQETNDKLKSPKAQHAPIPRSRVQIAQSRVPYGSGGLMAVVNKARCSTMGENCAERNLLQ